MSTESVEPVVQSTLTNRTLGTAYTFFTNENFKQARDLVKILDEAKQEVDPRLREASYGSRGGNRPYGRGRYGNTGGSSRGGYNNRSGGGGYGGARQQYGANPYR